MEDGIKRISEKTEKRAINAVFLTWYGHAIYTLQVNVVTCTRLEQFWIMQKFNHQCRGSSWSPILTEEILAIDSFWGREVKWMSGLSITRSSVVVHVLCWCWESCWCSLSILPLKSMGISLVCAAIWNQVDDLGPCCSQKPCGSPWTLLLMSTKGK